MDRIALKSSTALAAAVAFAGFFTAAPTSAAVSYSTSFETFPTGDIGTQDGWSRTVNSPTMGVVTNTIAQSGAQSLELRETNTIFNGVANHQTSPAITGAGETGATVGGAIGGASGGAGLNRFEASLWYRADSNFTSWNSNRMAEFDPASGGNRYAVARAYDDGATWSLKLSDLSQGVLTAQSGLAFDTWYRITMSIDFVNGLGAGGVSNDVFTISIFDGVGNLLGSQTAGTWESGYVGGGFGGGPLARVVDGMDFWGYGNTNGMSSGAIDDISYLATQAVPEPTSFAVLGLGAGALLLRRRRRAGAVA